MFVIFSATVEAFCVVHMSVMFALAEQDLVVGGQLELCVAVESLKKKLITDCSF